jgi:hypothetical protein
LRDLLGEDASGLSASSIQRLTEQWQAEHAQTFRGCLGVEQDPWVMQGILQACGVRNLMHCGPGVRMRCWR